MQLSVLQSVEQTLVGSVPPSQPIILDISVSNRQSLMRDYRVWIPRSGNFASTLYNGYDDHLAWELAKMESHTDPEGVVRSVCPCLRDCIIT